MTRKAILLKRRLHGIPTYIPTPRVLLRRKLPLSALEYKGKQWWRKLQECSE